MTRTGAVAAFGMMLASGDSAPLVHLWEVATSQERRVLYYAKDIWPHFISCVLVVHEKLIEEHPSIVKDLVRGIAESGEWAETHRLDAARVVAPYFRQDESLVRFVLTQPPDRVSYRMLTPTDEEMRRIHDMALKAGILEKSIDMRDLVDRSFIPADIKPAEISAQAEAGPE
jgi:NitT/TauT family transport system substrate-binding protein